MKHILFLFALCVTVSSCAFLFGDFPTTSFYIKNDSDVPIYCEIEIMKRSATMGLHSMRLPFKIAPDETVLARQVGFPEDGKPQDWFRKFDIIPTEAARLKDPYLSHNWVRSTDKKDRPAYTFIIAE